MAKNWKVGEAVRAIKAGNKEDILDIGRRFPLFANLAAQVNEAGVELLDCVPEYCSARKIESVLKGDVQEAADDDREEEEAPAEKKGPVKRKQKVEGPRSLKVITYNVGRFMLASGEDSLYTRKECMDSIFRFVARQEPDIICFQEFYLKHGQSVRSSLPKQLRNYKAEYYFFTTSYGLCGNLTLSRMKAVGKGKVKFDESANLALYTDYEAFDRKFRVYNCHFESYNISFPGIMRSLTKSETDIFSETGEKMKRSITMRPSQVAQVLSYIEACPIESFVCGDFNDNPVSYTYYRMTRGRRDAFVDAGHGFGATYSMLWPMLRIDYVLYPDCYRAVSYEVPRIGLSDHYPVITEISI